MGIFAQEMAIIKGEESIQEGQLKQESNVTEWDRARGIIARGLKLAAAIMGGLVYTSTKSLVLSSKWTTFHLCQSLSKNSYILHGVGNCQSI